MDRFRIVGPSRLCGRVRASGAKNAALPALAASLLIDEPLRLRRVPNVRDITTMRRLLRHCGVESADRPDGVELSWRGDDDAPCDAPYELVKTMRAGVLVLGPLLARRGRARVSLPGGCAIGVRPIDQHLLGLEALGAEITLDHGYVQARVTASSGRLQGARFRFAQTTVTGTENLLMAATLAEGTTGLENCAREPEVTDLARLLGAMGARIEGAGTTSITIEGVAALHGAAHDVIGDRIEGGTYLLGAALTGGDVALEGVEPDALAGLLEVLDRVGIDIDTTDGAHGAATIRVRGGEPGAVQVATAPFPGFPTDLQAQLLVLLTQARGVSSVEETIFENRFQHVAELVRMGADIRVEGSSARVAGPTPLAGATVMATDLRASACLVLAGLVASGETTVDRIYHLDRGYEKMEAKLAALGAHVERLAEPQP